jgi:hypothetical protein
MLTEGATRRRMPACPGKLRAALPEAHAYRCSSWSAASDRLLGGRRSEGRSAVIVFRGARLSFIRLAQK